MRRMLLIVAALALGSSSGQAKPTSPLAAGPHNQAINGVRLWYRVAGVPSGIPVVFLHGGPGEGSQSFEMIAGPFLERKLRMVYLDQRGSGRSERPSDDAYSIRLLVDDLEKLRQSWRAPKIDLVGHSAGTIIEMEYAAKYPDRVRRMVLAASGPDLGAAFELMCERVRRSNPEAYHRAVAALEPRSKRRCNMWGKGVFPAGGMQAFVDHNMFPDPATKKLVNDADNANGLRNTGELSSALIREGLLDYRFDHTARLTMPVLVIAGGRDFQAAIEPQRAFFKKLPHGSLSEWNEAGHFMWAENPKRFAAEVTAFLSR
jgi:proline iminopeptidase